MRNRSPVLCSSTPRLPGVLLLFLLATVGCRGGESLGDPSIGMEVRVAPTPPTVGESRVVVALMDGSGDPLRGARVSVVGDMAHAGMVPVERTAHHDGEGRYVVDAFPFVMAGDWILTVRATLGDGSFAVRTFPMRAVSPP